MKWLLKYYTHLLYLTSDLLVSSSLYMKWESSPDIVSDKGQQRIKVGEERE
jgi:hypothetical protein